MRKLCFLNLLLLTVLLGSCKKSPVDKVNALITDYMLKSLYIADSYEPLDTKKDSAFTPYDTPEFYSEAIKLQKLGEEFEEYKSQAQFYKSMMALHSGYYISAYDRNEIKENKAKYNEYIQKQEKTKQRIQKSVDRIQKMRKVVPEFAGYAVFHRYRAKNNMGQIVIEDMFFLIDQNCTQILYGIDVDSEEYKAAQQLIEEIEEKED